MAVWPGESQGGNPFVDIFAGALRQAGAVVVAVASPADCAPASVDVFHMHWPEQVFWDEGGGLAILRRVASCLRGLWRLRRAGVKVVWMVHNLEPHDLSPKRRGLWLLYQAALCRLTSGFMTLCPATVPLVRAAIPGLRGKPACFAWLPAYPRAPGDPGKAGRTALRDRLQMDEDARLLVFAGLVRPYKGVEALITAFRQVPDPGMRLLVAGQTRDPAFGRALHALAAGDRRVTLDFRHLPEAEFATALAAADAAVMPFRRYLHSSSLLHAVGEGCPVLTPETPYARALREAIGGEWVQLYDGALTAAALLAVKPAQGAADLSRFSAPAMAGAALGFYRELLAG